MKEPDFAPPWWLRSGHLQTGLASLRIRQRDVRQRAGPLRRHALEKVLRCPGDVRLHGLHSRHPDGTQRALAILIHGWEGSSDSLYLESCAAHLFNAGFDVFRLHLRDHGPSHHLNEGVFHSCRIEEAFDAVQLIEADLARGPICLAGFSLGGNFAARIAARAPAAGLALCSTVGVCAVLNPAHTLQALENGWFLYRHYFLRKWQRSLHLKAHYFPHRYRVTEFGPIKSLMRLTEYFVLEHSEFSDMESYFRGYALVGEQLANLASETHLIMAEDDPIIPVADLADVARTEALTVTRTRYGGHCGYLESLRGPSWADKEILRRFLAALEMPGFR